MAPMGYFIFGRTIRNQRVEMAQYIDMQKNLQPGVDKGLIEMFLKMTPEERLRANDNIIRAVVELRNAFRKQKTSSIRSKRFA
jgi:hypothetical protein